jgi:hypothetical protein
MSKLPLCCGLILFFAPVAAADDDFFKPKEEEKRSPAGKSETLRHVPKKFAAFQSADPAKHMVTLLVEGEKQPTTWPVNPDAELKIHGWWGRLEQFRAGDRVWVWFDLNRKKEPKSILMLADEISQQDINGTPLTVEKLDADAKTLQLKPAKGDSRTVAYEKSTCDAGIKTGDAVFVQTANNAARRVVDSEGLEKLRCTQKALLRERWIKEGLPGAVTFLHPLGGEMDVILDHEAIRWARSLKKGDVIKLATTQPIDGLVKESRPWRERTQLRLVVNGLDQSDLQIGQRIHLRMPTPAAEVDASDLPPDLDRPRSKEDRVEWFLASIYCSCNIRGDRCTGMFYTLASCNTHACGMPNQMRGRIGKLIDEGMNDQQIFEVLKKEQGPLLLKQHLLPQ